MNVYIVVRLSCDNYRHYGKAENKKVELNLMDDHFFLQKQMPITSYALKHYLHLKDMEKFNDKTKTFFSIFEKKTLKQKHFFQFQPLTTFSSFLSIFFLGY